MGATVPPRWIARNIRLETLFDRFGWKVRRHRATCGLCKGSSQLTVSFNDRNLWHCHRCNAGGDCFDFIRAVLNCDFPAALQYVADLAGVQLDNNVDRRQLARLEDERRRLKAIADERESQDRRLRIQCRDYLHDLHVLSMEVSGWLAGCDDTEAGEKLWDALQEVTRDIETESARYALLAFATVSERLKYLRSDLQQREEIIATARERGYVCAGDGARISVTEPGNMLYRLRGENDV